MPRRLYSDSISDKLPRPGFQSLPRKFQVSLSAWGRWLKMKPENKNIELGCGRGEFLNGFSNLGLDCYGLDKSDYAKKICQNAKIFQMDITKDKIPVDENYFDCVYSKSFIEHFYYPEQVFKEIYRVLKPGGLVITLTPSWTDNVKVFYEDYTHRTPFTKVSLGDEFRWFLSITALFD